MPEGLSQWQGVSVKPASCPPRELTRRVSKGIAKKARVADWRSSREGARFSDLQAEDVA